MSTVIDEPAMRSTIRRSSSMAPRRAPPSPFASRTAVGMLAGCEPGTTVEDGFPDTEWKSMR
jgi:hypothetical protein